MKEKEKMQLPKVTVDDFFTTQKERDEKNLERVQILNIKDISDFPNHPYKVIENEELEDMVKGIKENGIHQPVLVRPKEDGTYEMISGHRRKRASELAEVTTIPAIVREMTDDEAIITMVDSNQQREKVLPSEKAFAYKMKLDALKRQGKRTDLTSDPVGLKLNSAKLVGEEIGDSETQVKRYIRLTYLIPDLLQLVDDERIKLRPAVEISYLKKEEQEDLFDSIECLQATPSTSQAMQLRELSEKGELNCDKIDEILGEEKPNQVEQIKFKYNKIKDYFPKNYTVQQMENVIQRLLERYKLQWQNKENLRDR